MPDAEEGLEVRDELHGQAASPGGTATRAADGAIPETLCETLEDGVDQQRLGRLWHLATRKSLNETPTSDEMLYWLTDEQAKQDITAQHVLIRPAQGEMRLFVPSNLM